MTRAELNTLKRKLWPSDAVRPVRMHAVLDCARHPDIHGLITRSYREKTCLFAGALHPTLEAAAPYLVELSAGDSLTDEILLRGWTDAWGILIRTDGSARSLRRHLRTLLRVRLEDGRYCLFRFYDPRVLVTYLPTCTSTELATVYGEAVEEIYAFAGDMQSTQKYALRDGMLAVSAP